MKILASILAVTLLAGCATNRSAVTVLQQEVPQSLLHCKDQPASPKAGTQRDAGNYIIDLADAGQDCRTKLNTVRGLLDDQETSK